MRLRHIRRDEEQAIRERLSKDLLVSIRMVRDGDGEGVAEIEIDSGVYAASILAHVRAAGIHPTADGWMMDEEHGAETATPLPERSQDDLEFLRSAVLGAVDGGKPRRAIDILLVACALPIKPTPTLPEVRGILMDIGAVKVDGNGERWALPPKSPKPTLADRIAALIEDHVRDTRAERDAYKRELDELRARVGEFVDRMSKP